MNRHQRRAAEAKGTILVIFRRSTGWYPLELPHDADLAEHARLNPGTLWIEDVRTGEVLWRPDAA